MLKSTKKALFLTLGWAFFTLGIIGIPLPVLPTTPFLLLSAYFFSQSSPELHQWLINKKVVGPMIKDWHNHKVIRPKAKVMATSLIILLGSYTIIYVDVNNVIKGIVGFTLVSVIIFILTRNSHRETKQP